MKTGWGILGTLAAATAGMLPLTGCMSYSCTAMGWTNTVTVALEGQVAAVTEVRLCDEQICSMPAPDPDADVPLRTIEPTSLPEQLSPTAPTPAAYIAARTDKAAWEIRVNMNTPRNVTVSALSADGTALVQQDYELEWTRVGGSEQCGGRMSTPPIELRIP